MEDANLKLSESEQLDLNSFFVETTQSDDFLSHEVQNDKESSELYWVGTELGKRMFDLCIDFNDHKLTCMVYECDPCVDSSNGSDTWTTNIHKYFVLHKNLDAFQLAELQEMQKWKLNLLFFLLSI